MISELKIGDCCQVLSSKRIFAEDYVDEGIPFYRSKEIIYKALNQFERDEVFIKEERFFEIKNKYGSPKKGDVLISAVGNRSGICYWIKEDYDFYFKDGNLIWLKKFNHNLDSKYLVYLLNSTFGQGLINNIFIGAAQKALTIDGVKKIKLELPPLPTQRRIASILSAYDDLIENNLKRIKLLEELAQRTYEEWFVKFRINGEPLPIDEKTGLPEGWSIIEFQDVGQIVTGKTPSTTNELFFDGEIPFVKTPDMSGFPYVLTTSQYLSELGANTQKNKCIPKNSLMVSCIGSAGVIALASQSCQTNQQINTIVFKESIYTFYFYCFAKGLKPVLEALGSNGATMTNVNKGKFEKIKIVCPDRENLEEFHGLSNPIFELILDLQKQNQKLKESRDILLPKLMNGTITVEKE